MSRPYVDCVRIENFRCVKRADISLTPLHALIGPNDAGKSSILQAIAGDDVRFWVNGWSWSADDYAFGAFPHATTGSDPDRPIANAMQQRLRPRRLLRFDPDVLRLASPLIPRGSAVWFADERGRGLGSMYDALLSRDRAAFGRIDERFRALFPTVQELRLDNIDAHTKAVGLTLVGGQDVGPEAMSEGMLYWLAFAIIQELAPHGMQARTSSVSHPAANRLPRGSDAHPSCCEARFTVGQPELQSPRDRRA